MHPFTKIISKSVSALGEERLITEIQRWLGSVSPRAPFGIGDDCAVLPPSRGPQLITVDPVIYPRHFNDRVDAGQVGAKLLKRNLSDLAAMGGRPTAAVLALTLAPEVSLTWLEKFYRGLAKCARQYDVRIVGGDVAQANGALAASLTLLGEATGPRTLTRNGARAGDYIYVTGRLGRSLQSGHHFSFTPRLKEGSWLAQQPQVCAMMDVSDGLAKDLHALTPLGSTPAVMAATVPRQKNASLRAALTDGEDYELLFVLHASSDRARFEQQWRRSFPRVLLTPIGRFVSGEVSGKGLVDFTRYHGYEHLLG